MLVGVPGGIEIVVGGIITVDGVGNIFLHEYVNTPFCDAASTNALPNNVKVDP